LIQSYTVVFQVLVGEDLLEVVLSVIRAVGWTSIIYFILLTITGRYLLLQMFLAVMLGAFEEARQKVNFGQITSKAFISKILRRRNSKKYDQLILSSHKDNMVHPGSLLIYEDNPIESKLVGLMNKHHDAIKAVANIQM
jgi:hypothetical protein